MNVQLEKAKSLLCGKTVFAYCDNNSILTSDKPGIGFLIGIKDDEVDTSSGAVADKIVGKAAALLFARLGIKYVYAATASSFAVSVFERFGMEYECGKVVENIVNREGNGICPMEMTVRNIDDPDEAYTALVETLKKLRVRTGSAVPDKTE